MDNNLVMQAQRPALTQEKYIRVLSLKEDNDRLSEISLILMSTRRSLGRFVLC